MNQNRSIMIESPDDAVITLMSVDYTGTHTDDLIDTWIAIGNRNPWIVQAYDPPLTRDSFRKCDVPTFFYLLQRNTWSLGTAFYMGDLCFIQQVDGGDEWLTIKGDVAFESMSWLCILEHDKIEGAYKLMADLTTATVEECRTLEYEGAVDRRAREEACGHCSGCDIDCPLI